MNPISASCFHAFRGGSSRTSASNTSAPMTNRQKISVTGDTSRRAAFVATNEIPQKTMAMKARKRRESMREHDSCGGGGRLKGSEAQSGKGRGNDTSEPPSL